jgi:hypothetical protein
VPIGNRWRRVGLSGLVALALGLALAGLVGGGRPGSAAQQAATPPGPSECTVAPRQIPPPPATPIPAPAASPTAYATPTGQPADTGTVQAVSATIRESVACANAGDALRDLALFSDRYVENYLYGPTALDISIFRQTAATPQPAAPGEELSIVSISDVKRLGDGRVAATVVTQNAATTFTDELILINERGRWVIDEFHQLATKTQGTAPAAATSAATTAAPSEATSESTGEATIPPIEATATAGS